MLKKIVLAGAAFAFVGAASLTVPAQAGMLGGGLGDSSSCRKIAKEHFPDDRAARKSVKQECKAHEKSAKKMDKEAKKAAS